MNIKQTLLLITFSAALVCQNALAEALRDPTQLPHSSMHQVAHVDSNTTTAYQPVLQSVMLSDSVKAAIINGKQIRIGEQFEKATLIALTENTATLRSADGQDAVLKMPHIMIKKLESDAIDNGFDQPLMANKK